MSRLPSNFLRPLPADTLARVRDCYEVRFERDRQGREDWTEVGLSGPDGDGLNPGLFLDKFCPDATTLKKREGLFYTAWKTMADGKPSGQAAALRERRAALLASLDVPTRTLIGKVVWRMVIGLGNPNPLETSLTLHPQYGVPIIPGSAVKGLARHGRLREIGEEVGVYPLPFEAWERRTNARPPQATPLELLGGLLTTQPADAEDKDRAKRFQELQQDDWVLKGEAAPKNAVTGLTLGDLTAQYGKDFRSAFGTTGRRGEVTFLDALPLPGWTYDLDVMTPHYGDYYGDRSNTVAPADWLEPNPITFLTIGKNSRFRFDVSGRDGALLDAVAGWLKKALTDLGTGGKTSAGYGEMQV